MRRSVAMSMLAIALLATASCWYSSTRPERTPPVTGNDDAIGPDEVQVSGLVQLFDRTDHHHQTRPGWFVQATVWTRDPHGGTSLFFGDRQILRSNPSGVYMARFRIPEAVAIDLQARLCEVDLEGLDCCFGSPPCPPSQCVVWTPARRVAVTPGLAARADLTVGCVHVP